jgi:hypothetical protein
MCRGEVFGRTLSFRRPFLLLRVVAAYDLVCSPSLSCRPQATGASSLCPQLPAANLSADRADNGQADDANHRRGGIGAFFLMTTHARLRRWLKNASNSARPTVTARPSGRGTAPPANSTAATSLGEAQVGAGLSVDASLLYAGTDVGCRFREIYPLCTHLGMCGGPRLPLGVAAIAATLVAALSEGA